MNDLMAMVNKQIEKDILKTRIEKNVAVLKKIVKESGKK